MRTSAATWTRSGATAGALLRSGDAPIHDQPRSHDEARLVRGQVEGGRGDVLGPAELGGELPLADRGVALLRVLVRLLEVALHERREDRPGQQRIDANPMLGDVDL